MWLDPRLALGEDGFAARLSPNCHVLSPKGVTYLATRHPYNRAMLHNLNAMLAPALMERLVLVVNHVLGAEPTAMARLKPHARRSIQLQMAGWPALLPAPPVLAFKVTPAGMLEWCGGAVSEEDADLRVRVDAANPLLLMARAMAGDKPSVDIDGDAQLAADVNWLLQNLRWDVAADLERVFGPAIAYPLHRLGSALARGLKSAMDVAPGLAQRMRPPSP
jgi:ubiquinone biosynthesis protein UbiJ